MNTTATQEGPKLETILLESHISFSDSQLPPGNVFETEQAALSDSARV